MSVEQLIQHWRSLLGLTIAGGMLVWGRFLDPGSVDGLAGMHMVYGVLCIIASMASIALVLQEMNAAALRRRLQRTRQIRQAHQEFSSRREPLSEAPCAEA